MDAWIGGAIVGAIGGFLLARRWYAQTAQRGNAPIAAIAEEQASRAEQAEKPESVRPLDEFEARVLAARAEANQAVRIESEVCERQLAEKYGDHMALKAKLTQFVRAAQLDVALIDFYKDAQHYPAWSQRDDWPEYNTYGLENIESQPRADIGSPTSVSFTFEGSRYALRYRSYTGMTSAYLELIFFECDEEMFAADYELLHVGEYDTQYAFKALRACKKRGGWAEFLIECSKRKAIARATLVAESRYIDADQIKDKFKL